MPRSEFTLAATALALAALMAGALAVTPGHWLLVLLALACGLAWLCRCRSLSWRHGGALLLLLLALAAGSSWRSQASPPQRDPLLAVLNDASMEAPQQIEAVLLADSRTLGERCQALLAVERVNGRPVSGRTELQIQPCEQGLEQGWRIAAEGRLRQPAPAAHPLVPGAAERLAAQGVHTQFRAEAFRLLSQQWTPLADARRRIAAQLQRWAGPREGSLLAALVLGSAQVSVPSELRDAFRVAGLSHALAASGFHLSVLLGTTLALVRSFPVAVRLGGGGLAMASFLALAGGQPSVVRAVLMGAAALLIREGGGRSRPLGVLLITLVLMLLIHPAWARSIGFQLSAAATAGLVISAGPIEAWLAERVPRGCLGWLPAALSVPLAALLWTLPLQLLHFGSTPLYALVANLLAAPLLAPLTLAAMALALTLLILPAGLAALLLPWLIWPVAKLAGLLIALVLWISTWPYAQLLTGRPQPWVVLLLLLGLLPWCLPALARLRWRALPLVLLAVIVQASVQLKDGLVVVGQWGRHWVLARHQGRAALVSSHGDGLSCALARRLSEAHGHRRLDWVAVLDPVASSQQRCWRSLARTVLAEHQGQSPLQPGQRLASAGLELGAEVDAVATRALWLRAGAQRLRLQRATGRPLQ